MLWLSERDVLQLPVVVARIDDEDGGADVLEATLSEEALVVK